MANLILFSPEHFLADAATNFPQYLAHMPGAAFRSSLAFDNTVSEKCRSVSFKMPVFAGALTIRIRFAIAATTGNVQFRVQCEAITPADALNTSTTRSFASANSSSSTSVPGTTFNTKELTIALTNDDSVAAGDTFTFTIDRDVSVGSNAAGDCYLLEASLEDAS